ncbi:MAG: CpaF family protein, partial [Myxococcota bacterium]
LEERREERSPATGLGLLDDELEDDDEDDLFPEEPPKPQPKPAPRPAVRAAPPSPAIDEDLDDDEEDDLLDFPELPPAKPDPAPAKTPPREAAPAKARVPEPKQKARPSPKAAPRLQPALPAAAALQARAAVFSSVLKALAPQGLPAEDEATVQKATTTTERTLQAVAKKLTGTDTSTWAEEIAAELTAFGPLEALLDDPDIGEVYVNGPYQVLALRRGELQVVPHFFSSEEAVALVARRLLAPSGVEFDAEHPIAETRLQDGTRVNAVHHAVSVRGPVLTIARSTQKSASLEELVQESVMSSAMAEFLSVCVQTRRNVLVCGSSGAGVGTLLHAMAMTLPGDERIVTIEPVARLNLPHPHVVSLEPRPHQGRANHASMRDLVANALRMRPGRLICQDVSGGEALELLVAMAGGQDGTLLSTYGSSVRDGLARLETMMLMAGRDLPSRVLREQVASSIDIVVMLTRFPDGSSRVTQIAEIAGAEVVVVTSHELFSFKREGSAEDGRPQGRFTA